MTARPCASGKIVKESFPTGMPKILSAFVFNTRRPIFADIRVREAIALLFDSDWANKNFFFGLYRRNAGYFDDSELSAIGRPADARRAQAPARAFPGAVRDDVLEGKWTPPATDASGRDRDTLKKALALLSEAGFDLVGTELRDRKTGAPFTFEILATTREQERLALAFARDLKRAGITANLRNVDAVQFDRRMLTYDYDMIALSLGPVAVARQRAGLLLGLGGRRHRRHPQLYGGEKPGHRRRHRGLAAGARTERIRLHGARARPNPDIRFLRRAALSPAGTMGRSRLDHRTSRATPLFGYLPETWWRAP